MNRRREKGLSLRLRINGVMVILMAVTFAIFAGFKWYEENRRVDALIEEKKLVLSLAALSAAEGAEVKTKLMIASPFSPAELQTVAKTFHVPHLLVLDKEGEVLLSHQ